MLTAKRKEIISEAVDLMAGLDEKSLELIQSSIQVLRIRADMDKQRRLARRRNREAVQ